MRSAFVAWVCLTASAAAVDPAGLAADVVAHAGADARQPYVAGDFNPICHKDHSGLALASAEIAAMTHARIEDAKAKGGMPITIAADGLGCPFCAAALARTFNTRGDVAAAAADPRVGTITLVVEAGGAIEDRTIRKIVSRRGYTVAAIDRSGARAPD